MSINSRMNKQVLIYLHHGILLSNKKEHAVCSHDMAESQKTVCRVKESFHDSPLDDSAHVKV